MFRIVQCPPCPCSPIRAIDLLALTCPLHSLESSYRMPMICIRSLISIHASPDRHMHTPKRVHLQCNDGICIRAFSHTLLQAEWSQSATHPQNPPSLAVKRLDKQKYNAGYGALARPTVLTVEVLQLPKPGLLQDYKFECQTQPFLAATN